jgi:hypothetical protein
MPKRLLLMHLHHTEADAAAPPRPDGHVASRVTDAQWSLAGADSTPIDVLLRGMRLPAGQARRTPRAGNEWSSIYPISELLDARLLPTKPLSPLPVGVLPYARLVSEDTNVLTAADGGGSYRDVTFEVFSERPCWGLLNITAETGLLSWSLTPEAWPRAGAPTSRIVRWTSQRAGGGPWRISARLAAGSGAEARLRVQLHVDYLDDTRALRAMTAKLPPWGTMTYAATGFISDWVL